LIKDRLYWKTGVILKDKTTLAQVTEDYEGRYLNIAIKGPLEKELLYRITSEIDSINMTYHFSERIKTVKLVPCKCGVCDRAVKPHFYDYDILVRRIEILRKETIECQISAEDVKVYSLLSAIKPTKPIIEQPKNFFISYAHKDVEYKEKLETALAVQERKGKITIWNDQEILAGQEWNAEIESHLEKADVIVLLLSADFFASDYIWDHELPIVKKCHEEETAIVIPVLLSNCDWSDSGYSHMQAVPIYPETLHLLPVARWEDSNEAWNIVVQEIKKVLPSSV